MEVFDQARFLISENESARIQRGEFSGRWYPETYEYMGVWYFVKLGLSLFLNTLIFGRSLYMLWIVRKIKSDTKSRVDVQDICLIFNILACFIRMISMLDPAKADYTKPFGDIFSTVASAILAKIPQILWMAGIVFLVVFWRDLVKSTQKLQKKSETKKIGKSVIILISVLFLVVLPLAVIQSLVRSRMLQFVSNNFFGLYILTLTIGGVLYARKLGKLCEKLKSDGGKETLMKIQRTVRNLIIFATISIGAIVWNTLDSKRIMKQLTFWYIIFVFIEPFIAFSILQAVAPKEDIAKKWANKKFRSSKGDSNDDPQNTKASKTRPSTAVRASVTKASTMETAEERV